MGPRTCPDDMFMYVESGRMWMAVGGRRTECGPGDLLHWRRHEVHSAGYVDGPLVVVAVHFDCILSDGSPLPECVGLPNRLPATDDDALPELFWQAARIGTCRPPGWRTRLNAGIDVILGHVLDCHAALLAPAGCTRRNNAWTRIRPAVQAMLGALSSPPSMASLARRCGLSSVQFRRVFRQASGISPRTWLGQRRIEEACRLLRDGRTIAAVAATVGFAEPPAFVTAFRRATGLPPGRWLEENAP